MKNQIWEKNIKSLNLADISSGFSKPKRFATTSGLRNHISKAISKNKAMNTGGIIRSATVENPSVTVIIPSYNTSLYIEQCINTICSQTLENIEIIIVDDASTDDTVQKILPLTYIDKRITLIVLHKQSGSPGKARNIGMALASAPYISFIDSDDWIEADMLEQLYTTAVKKSSDICFLSGFINHLDEKSNKRFYKKPHVDPSSELFGFHESFMLWDKLWSVDFLVNHNLEIAHTSASEELLFIIKAYYLARNISVSTGNYGYNYRRLNPSSITKNIRSNVYPSYEFEAWGLVDNWLKSISVSESYKNIVSLRKLLSFNYALSIVHASHKEKFSEEIKNYLTDVIDIKVKDVADKLGYTSQVKDLEDNLPGLGFSAEVSSSTSSNKNLIFGPDWSNSNPYQRLLYKSLRNVYNVYATGFSPKQLTKEYLLAKKPTNSVLHLHWLHPFYEADNQESTMAFVDTVKHAKELGYSIVWTAHNIMPHEVNISSEPNHLLVRERIIELCDNIIVHDQTAGEALSHKFLAAKDKISIAPHGLYEKTIHNGPSFKNSVKDALGVQRDRFTVLLAGRIRGYKGIERAINIFTKGASKLLSNCTLLIAGYPDDQIIDSTIQAAAAEFSEIKYIRGTISDSDLETLFIASDICLLPYEKSATSGLAFLSISYNTPLITSKLPAFQQFVSDGMAICADTDAGIEEAIYFAAEAFYSNSLDHIFHKVMSGDMHDLQWDTIVRRPVFSQLFSS